MKLDISKYCFLSPAYKYHHYKAFLYRQNYKILDKIRVDYVYSLY